MTRSQASITLGDAAELLRAAFHLDRLVAGGLLETEYRRRNGRSGPGAGRPAKLYRRRAGEMTVSLPPRRYDRVADILAEGLDRLEDSSGAEAVADVARERGSELGVAARTSAGPTSSRGRLLTALVDLLRVADSEPEVDAACGATCLRNCPYHALGANHRELTCGMNLAWAEGVVTALDPRLRPELAPPPGYCCVVFHQTNDHRRQDPRSVSG
jgi:predicted ArsR family transcriptional regulator